MVIGDNYWNMPATVFLLNSIKEALTCAD